jgi:hypothetical protein
MKRERKKVAEKRATFFRPQVSVGQSGVRREAGGIGPPQESTSDSGSTQAAQSQRQMGGYAGPAGRRGTARGMSSPTAAPWNNHRRQPFSPKGRRLPCQLRFNTRLNESAL